MRRKFLLIGLNLFILLSIGTSAINKDTLSILKNEKFNGWFYDKDIESWNLFENGEYVKNKWANNDGWYYLDENGNAAKGWKQINNSWYFLNKYSGVMRVGWAKDGSNWYYLNSNGTMAHDTTINGYKLGSNGAWIK